MLNSFPGFETSDPEINREVLLSNFSVSHFDCRHRERRFVARANWADTRCFRVTSAFCSVSTDTKYAAVPAIRQFYYSRPNSEVLLDVNGRVESLTPANPLITIPAETNYRCTTSNEHGVVALRIEMAELRSIATALLGDDFPLEKLIAERWNGDRFNHVMRSGLLQFVADLNAPHVRQPFASIVFGQALLSRILLDTSHEINRLLEKNTQAPSVVQLRQIEDYIAANWQRELDMQELSKQFGLSVRTIFRHFKTIRGTTPHTFIRTLRLDHARAMLQTAEGDDGVMSIAFKCGYQSMGHFARAYLEAFGELPSQTLNRPRPK